MASKTSQTNFREQGKRFLAELGTDFLEVESKLKAIYDRETLGKKAKA